VNDSVRYWLRRARGRLVGAREELAAFGAVDIRDRSHDVKFQGTSRSATAAFLVAHRDAGSAEPGSVEATTTEALFEGLKRFDWREHLAPGATLACDCSGGNAAIRHTIYGSAIAQDAVCDKLRESTGERPVIRPRAADVLLHLHVEGRPRWCRWTSPGRACIGAAIEPKGGVRR